MENNIKSLNISLIGDNARKATWSFVGGWNASLEETESWGAYERDNAWASELGKSLIDVWLTMGGVEASNPFSNRAKRKFDAGVMWEWIVELVAKRAGIFISKQDRVVYQTQNGVKVTGKLDLLVGGKRNQEMIQKMQEALEVVSLPERFIKAMANVERKMNFEFELPERVLEVKSSSAYMYDAQYKVGIPSESHALQCLHYLLGTKHDEGAVLYISKDDARMIEIPVWRDDDLLNRKYEEVTALIKKYRDNKERPPKEPLIVFDYDQGRFTDNWNIKYSAYLTYLYGFETESDYRDEVENKIAAWNRVLGRVTKGKRMTDSNLEYIEEIKSEFPGFDDIVRHFRDEDTEIHKDGYKIGAISHAN